MNTATAPKLPIDLPSVEAMCLLTGLYHGDIVTLNDRGILVVLLAKAVEPPLPPGEHSEQVVTDATLDELEERGWINSLYVDTPTITQRGRYWLRRYTDRVLGKRIEPAIRLPATEEVPVET